MNTDELLKKISGPDVNIDEFVQMTTDDARVRDEIVHQMLTNTDIMVYYHCYYVVSKASQERPELYYPYWVMMVPLLKHANSYHRDFGLTILANLTSVDSEDRFTRIFDDYFEHINDKKFMTAQCCVRNSQKIIHHKPPLRDQIIGLLLELDNRCAYPDKQKALLKCDVLEIIDNIYQETQDKMGIETFIMAQVNSLSPKTKKKAKELVAKYGL